MQVYEYALEVKKSSGSETPVIKRPEILKSALLRFTAKYGLGIENGVVRRWRSMGTNNLVLSNSDAEDETAPVLSYKGFNGQPAVIFKDPGTVYSGGLSVYLNTVPVTLISVAGDGKSAGFYFSDGAVSYPLNVSLISRGYMADYHGHYNFGAFNISRFSAISRPQMNITKPSLIIATVDSEGNMAARVNGVQQAASSTSLLTGNIGKKITLSGRDIPVAEYTLFNKGLTNDQVSELEEYYKTLYKLDF